MSKVKFNICNAHVAVKSTDESGAVSYDKPFPVPGSVSLSLEAQGDITPFYADGIVYYKSAANSGYQGDWELALVPDIFREKILKEVLDKNKVMLEKMNASGAEFAFGFQIDGDVKNTRFWFYNCNATRPTTASSTSEKSKEPQTDTLTVSATSEKVIVGSDDYIVRAKTTDEVSSEIYDNWFKEVYIPELTATEPAAEPVAEEGTADA